ncbi:hypothetical protein EYF80_045333 [Liparis tanakae]|uniref:Uncharacterized protein n=1 Tax=Liparis tanakae TaxID=230148 RepID=A0A4Z2FUC6_9TELE|nr:hypothetical protein EYF80_045333 [Liparis tanakae]
MLPLTQSFETRLNQQNQEIQQNHQNHQNHQNLAQRGEELRTKLDAESQNLKKQLTALWESFTRTTQ